MSLHQHTKIPTKSDKVTPQKRKARQSIKTKIGTQAKKIRIAPCTQANKLLNIALLIFSLLILGLANSTDIDYDIIETEESTLHSSFNEEITVSSSFMKNIPPEKFNADDQRSSGGNTESTTTASQQLFTSEHPMIQVSTTILQIIKSHTVPAVTIIFITLTLLLVGNVLRSKFRNYTLRIRRNYYHNRRSSQYRKLA